MKIVVTGAAGYIGSLLCKEIVEQLPFAKVYAFDNLYYNQWEHVEPFLTHDRIKFYDEDILDWSTNLTQAIADADYVICLAAIVGAPACDKVPELSTDLNYNWYEDLLGKVDGSQKIIYPNTNSGYGTTPEGTICTEESPSNPLSLYGKLKQDTEDLLKKEYENVVCFRLATVFGLSGRPRLDLLVNNFVYRAVKDKHLDIFDGHFRRNFVSVKDVCRAFLFAMRPNNFFNMKGQVYNLGADTLNSTKLEFAQKIQEITGCELTEHNNKTDPDKRDYLVSSQKLYSLGFTPIDTTLDQKVRELSVFCSNISDTEGMFNY
jgi:nucleoside-diphosphate-sugar epimerase